MDRFWLLTTTFYGNWLPGDPRGFVSRVRDIRPGERGCVSARSDDLSNPARHEHDVPGTPYDEDLPGLHRAAREQLRSAPIRIGPEHASVLLEQFQETARCRGWTLLAVAIMSNHVHLVVGVMGDPSPTKVLGDIKAYGSRALNRRWGKPPSETWWTYDGSKRKLKNEETLLNAINYVRNQPNALLIWIDPHFLSSR